MFHLPQWTILSMLFQTHGIMKRAPKRTGVTDAEQSLKRNYEVYSPSPLTWWLRKLKRDPRIYLCTEQSCACHALLSHVLDGHILTALATDVKVSSVNDLGSALESTNWRVAIARIRSQFGGLNVVNVEKEKSLAELDIVRENAILFLQHVR
jgi:hypothetical protein